MYYLSLVISIVLLATGVLAQNPIGYQQWQVGEQTKTQFGGAPGNYQIGEDWAVIVNDFVVEGDSIFACEQSILKTRVNRNTGVSTVRLTKDGVDYTITQKLLGIAWINTNTRQSLWIDSTMNFNLVSRNGPIVSWTGVSPGVHYAVEHQRGAVHHRIFFTPAFLDSAITLYDQRADSLDIALANVIIYTLSSSINHHDSVFGDVDMRFFRDFGRMSFQSTQQQLHFPGMDTLPTIPVRQYWEKRGDKLICLEYVKMRRIKQVHEAYPTETLWHNDSKTFTNGSNVEDTYGLRIGGGNDNNYGADNTVDIDNTNMHCFLKITSVAATLGANQDVDSAFCSLYVAVGNENTIEFFRVFKPWNEGNLNGTVPNPGDNFLTWDECNADGGGGWTMVGCESANDGGSDNACNGSDADRKATAEASVAMTGDNGVWYRADFTTIVGLWYATTANENGVVGIGTGGGDILLRPSDYTTASQRTHWIVFHSEAGEAGDISYIRRIKEGEGK